MENSRKNSILSLLILIATIGCSTSSYRVEHKSDFSANIYLSPNRILLECEWLHDADIKGLYGFSIHVLDEKNTVLSVIQGNTLDEKSCKKRLKKIRKILKKGRYIEILGTGNLEKIRKAEDAKYAFPGLGTFHRNGRVLQFMAITNEHKDCYDAYSADEKACYQNSFK